MEHIPNAQPEDQLLSDLMNLRNLFSTKSRWVKGTWEYQYLDPEGSYCIMGGIQKVVNGTVVVGTRSWAQTFGLDKIVRVTRIIKALNAARNARRLKGGEYREELSLISWNDRESTTYSKLIEVIDRAIKTRMEERTLEVAKEAVNAA